MKEQNIRYGVSIDFPDLRLFEYYCERFGMSYSDLWLVLIAKVDYLAYARKSLIYGNQPNELPLTLSTDDYYYFTNDDFFDDVFYNETFCEIIEMINIPDNDNKLRSLLIDMYFNFDTVKTQYVIDQQGNYESFYDMHEVIGIIYENLLMTFVNDNSDKVIDMVNLKLAGYDLVLVEIIPDFMSPQYGHSDKLMIVYDIYIEI